jgi:hypothetical protein
MPNEIITKDLSETAFDIDLHSLTDTTAKQSDSVSNSNDYPAALIGLKITTGGTAHSDGSVFIVYLFRRLTNAQDDNAGATKTTITPRNMHVIGTLQVGTATNTAYEKVFTTEHLGPLGPEWGIAVKNMTNQTTHATAGNHSAHYRYYIPELQNP